MNVAEKLKALKNEHIDIETKTDIIRSLRNECAKNPEIVDSVWDQEELILYVLELINEIDLSEVNESELVFLRCSLQFVHNSCVGRSDFLPSHVMKLIFKCVKKCLQGKDFKVRNYASSCFLLILKQDFAFKTEIPEIKKNIVQNLIQGVKEDAEFCLFCVKHILLNEVDSVCQVLELIDIGDRLALIDIVMSLESVDEDLVRLLSQRFKVQSDQILTTFKSPKDPLEPEEVRSLLNCLCQFSSSDQLKQRQVLQEDKSLLINAIYLLKMINDLGKENSELFRNLFSPVRKISDLDNNDFSDSPVFGFKSDLIRLIGNLCWKHKENQSMVI